MTQRSVTYLKGRWETGDIPTQTDYQDLMDSFVNLEASAAQTMAGRLAAPSFTGKFIKSSESITPTGSTQASALAVSADVVRASAEQDGQRAIILSSLEPGRSQFICNTGTTVLQIFPPSGQNFIGSAANGEILCAVNQGVTVYHIASAYSFTRST